MEIMEVDDEFQHQDARKYNTYNSRLKEEGIISGSGFIVNYP